MALSKLGAHCLYLNTSFAGPQISDVVKREDASAIVYDQEFTELLEDAGKRRKRFIAWVEDDSSRDTPGPAPVASTDVSPRDTDSAPATHS